MMLHADRGRARRSAPRAAAWPVRFGAQFRRGAARVRATSADDCARPAQSRQQPARSGHALCSYGGRCAANAGSHVGIASRCCWAIRWVARRRCRPRCREPDAVARLIVADIAPVPYPPHLRPVAEAMAALPLSAGTTRAQADAALVEAVPEPGMRAFLLQNLQLGSTPAWRIGLQEIIAEFANIEAWDAPPGVRIRRADAIHRRCQLELHQARASSRRYVRCFRRRAS